MRRAIWKYEIHFADRVCIPMPKGAKVLSFQVQPDRRAVIWVEVDPNEEVQDRYFLLVVTGEPFDPTGLTYVGTIQTGDPFCPTVWHLYDSGPFSDFLFN